VMVAAAPRYRTSGNTIRWSGGAGHCGAHRSGWRAA
jgi:hypothetical protein